MKIQRECTNLLRFSPLLVISDCMNEALEHIVLLLRWNIDISGTCINVEYLPEADRVHSFITWVKVHIAPVKFYSSKSTVRCLLKLNLFLIVLEKESQESIKSTIVHFLNISLLLPQCLHLCRNVLHGVMKNVNTLENVKRIVNKIKSFSSFYHVDLIHKL